MELRQYSHSSASSTLAGIVPGADRTRIDSALTLIAEWYADRPFVLMENVSLFEHAVSVTLFLAEFCHDEDALIACLLQHALKVPDVTLDLIDEKFGRSVRDIVSRVHLLSHLYTADWRKSIDDMKIMLVSVSDDLRVLLIALSVACVFLQRLDHVHEKFRMRLCRQALQLFAPVAARLGIYALKYRLERGAFPYCYPSDSQLIESQVSLLHADHGSFLPQVSSAIRNYLQEQGIASEVMAREKQPYSIFQKMQSKSVSSLEKISDLFAIRVVVPTMQDCYRTLGFLHHVGTPISHRFKDYISFPKPNGYQSLHTCILGLPHAPKDMMIEVQIRTHEMHQEAEFGIAAHWLYKESDSERVIKGARQLHLTDVLLKQHVVGDRKHLIVDRGTALVDHIYVLTPQGDIVELPEGGTPLDFAFHVHTDLGLRFKSARVNGAIVPIAHALENGDVVEVLTHKHARPVLQWLEVLKTASARSKLKSYFFSHDRSRFLLAGKDFVNAELKNRQLPPLDAELTFLALFDGKELPLRDREDIIVKIGMGSMRTSSIFRHLGLTNVSKKNNAPVKDRTSKSKPTMPESEMIGIEGQKLSMPYRFAKCCNAEAHRLAEKKLLGVIARSGIIIVHRIVCKMGKSANPERTLPMYWIQQ